MSPFWQYLSITGSCTWGTLPNGIMELRLCFTRWDWPQRTLSRRDVRQCLRRLLQLQLPFYVSWLLWLQTANLVAKFWNPGSVKFFLEQSYVLKYKPQNHVIFTIHNYCAWCFMKYIQIVHSCPCILEIKAELSTARCNVINVYFTDCLIKTYTIQA